MVPHEVEIMLTRVLFIRFTFFDVYVSMLIIVSRSSELNKLIKTIIYVGPMLALSLCLPEASAKSTGGLICSNFHKICILGPYRCKKSYFEQLKN